MASKKFVNSDFAAIQKSLERKERAAEMSAQHKQLNDRKKRKIARYRDSDDSTERLLLQFGLKWEVLPLVDLQTIEAERSPFQTRQERVLKNSVDEYGRAQADGKVFRPPLVAVSVAERHNMETARKYIVAGFTRLESARVYHCTHAENVYCVVYESDADIQRLKDFSQRDNHENSGERVNESELLRYGARRLVEYLMEGKSGAVPTARELATAAKQWAQEKRLGLAKGKENELVKMAKQWIALVDYRSATRRDNTPWLGNSAVFENLYFYREKQGYKDLLAAVASALAAGVNVSSELRDNRGATDCAPVIKAVNDSVQGLRTRGPAMAASRSAMLALQSALKNVVALNTSPRVDVEDLLLIEKLLGENAPEVLAEVRALKVRMMGIACDKESVA